MKGCRRGVLLVVFVADVMLIALLWPGLLEPSPRVDDRVGIIPAWDEGQYNAFLNRVQVESGIDVRIALVPDTRGQPLERFALGTMRELKVGRETGGRGLLVVYDTLARAMRIEVGPKLEGILPDAFVGYLMREHVDAFFAGGRPELGLRTTLFMIHWRIRMARLGEEYDPSFEEYVRDVRRLASGGGASGRIALDTGLARFINTSGDTAASAYFLPQPSVEAAYRRHQEWLALGGGQVDVHEAPFPPLQLYRWRSGLLDETMRGLGIRVGRQWRPPLAAVLDRDGRVVWQSQGVTDWEAVLLSGRSAAGESPASPADSVSISGS